MNNEKHNIASKQYFASVCNCKQVTALATRLCDTFEYLNSIGLTIGKEIAKGKYEYYLKGVPINNRELLGIYIDVRMAYGIQRGDFNLMITSTLIDDYKALDNTMPNLS